MDKLQQKLFRACEHLDRRKVYKAIRQGARLDVFDEYGDTPLGCVAKSAECYMKRPKEGEDKITLREKLKEKACEILRFMLENGAQPDLCGGRYPDQPLVSAFYKRNYEFIKILLEAGADPNMNTCPESIGERSGILASLDFLISEDYGEVESAIEKLVRSYGGRLYWWDFDPRNNERIGKYYVLMEPTCSGLFWANDDYCIGDACQLRVEDENDVQTTIKLDLPELTEWYQQYLDNIKSPFSFDWDDWNKRGKLIAAKVAEILPDNVALFYPFEDEVRIEKTWRKNGYYLDGEYENVRIK